jgi:hypothetical protein
MGERMRNADFFAQLDAHVERAIQEADIDVQAIESEYRRALSDSKEAYSEAQTWRPSEHSNRFQDTLGRLFSAAALQKGVQRAEIFHATFKIAEKRFGKPATMAHMTPSRADYLYDVAHKSAYLPGYPYQPLEPRQFRYLELLPSEDPSFRPQCRLYRGEPADSHYAALSYVWGQRDASNPVFIELESQAFEVTPNLFSALQELRHPTQKIALWVDAICINQKDVLERNEQVKLMTAIYENANLVLMWMGRADKSSIAAMKFLVGFDNGISEQRARADLLQYSFDIQAGLIGLLSRRYWSRVWIMQEVIVSRAAYICCGSYVASWAALTQLLVPLSPMESLQLQLNGQYLGFHTIQKTASDLVWPMAQLNLKRQMHETITCWEGLQMARQRGATDARDFIFSLLGFVDEMPIEVDYGTPVPELYRSLVMNFITRDKTLDILTMCRNFDPSVKGGHRNADDQLTSSTISGLSGMLQLLLLNLGNAESGDENEDANVGSSSGEKGGHGSETSIDPHTSIG